MKHVTIPVQELSGQALAWAFAHAEERQGIRIDRSLYTDERPVVMVDDHLDARGEPMEFAVDDPMVVHPVIDREGMSLRAVRRPGHALDGRWYAMLPECAGSEEAVCWREFEWLSTSALRRRRLGGCSSLEAAARCWVAHKIGPKVSVPADLCRPV